MAKRGCVSCGDPLGDGIWVVAWIKSERITEEQGLALLACKRCPECAVELVLGMLPTLQPSAPAFGTGLTPRQKHGLERTSS